LPLRVRWLSIITAILAGNIIVTSGAAAADNKSAWRPGDKILFQGDSITDANRGPESTPDAGLGHGYVHLVAARLSADHPASRLVVVNRGVSGDEIHDLVHRWKRDTIALRPEILSILVGINDTAAEMPLHEFEAAYATLLEQTKAALPNVRLVLCEPFALLPRNADDTPHRWDTNVRERARIVERLAIKHRAPFVRFQKVFDDAAKRAPAEQWLYDGIHPTHPGHQLMADEWIRAVSAFDR
jgi:lysophospholipase L1-like esterase